MTALLREAAIVIAGALGIIFGLWAAGAAVGVFVLGVQMVAGC